LRDKEVKRKLSANKDAKAEVIANIRGKLERANGVVLVEYAGMNVLEVTDLRNQFRKAGVEYRVLKNTLVSRAAGELKIEGLEPFLKGTTALAFGYEDPTSPAKVLAEYNKKAGKLKIKCGLMSGKLVKAGEVEDLAKIPAKEVLVAKMLGTMNAPITNFASVLNGPARALVCALKAIEGQKEKSA
jgi:large subunit ribosomal protein L10